MAFEVRIPTLGESVTEGVIVRWAKHEGDTVAKDEVLLELETDKASMEITAEEAGVLHIVKHEGETVVVGEVVARIEIGARAETGAGRAVGAAGPSPPRSATEPAASRPGPAPVRTEMLHPSPGPIAEPNLEAASEQDVLVAPAGRSPGPLSPAVRRLVQEHALDVATIAASGRGGRLTKEDVLAHLERTEVVAAGTTAAAATPGPGGAAPPVPPPRAGAPGAAGPVPRLVVASAPPAAAAAERRAAAEGEEPVPMSRLRKRIAERLVQAQHTAAILTTFNEIDMSAVMALRAAHKERFQKVHGVALGFMSFFARACIAALPEIPAINAEIRGDDVVYKHFVHLGVAVGTERGLIVPVVHDAHAMTFAALEREIGRLAGRARDGSLSLDELSGGTFTISNGGVYGSLLSTPILNPPQSGILGMHKIEKRAVVIGDQIVVRPMMYVALSYDHRLVDGEQAVTFLVRVKERLEDPARLLLDL
jgi:2-oxoglutarate dehydrogenase E2 component (dihydrolipoamide succinyltransferase)